MKKLLSAAIIATALAGFGSAPAAAQDGKTVKIGAVAWADAEFVSTLAQTIINDRIDGVNAEITQLDIAPLFQGLAKGDLDVTLNVWLPGTHADYWQRVGKDVVTLGVVYTDAKLGWVVPTYIPEDQIASIADLKKAEVKDKLGGKVQGIDPGAGLTRLSKEAIDKYGLEGYELVTASDAAMTAALDRAIRRKDWIVATGWSPHWMFGAYDLRYIADPENALGGVERVYTVSRKGFQTDFPQAAEFLMRMHLPVKELEAAMFDARETSVDEAVKKYIETHKGRVDYWVTGEIDS